MTKKKFARTCDESRRVVITIHRGIPEITECPDGIDVEVSQ